MQSPYQLVDFLSPSAREELVLHNIRDRERGLDNEIASVEAVREAQCCAHRPGLDMRKTVSPVWIANNTSENDGSATPTTRSVTSYNTEESPAS